MLSVLWVSCVLIYINTSDTYSHISNVLHYFPLFPVLQFPNRYASFCSLLSLFQFPYSSYVVISYLSNFSLKFSSFCSIFTSYFSLLYSFSFPMVLSQTID